MISTDISTPLVVGIFQEPAQAAKAVRELLQAGFKRKDIGLAAREWHGAFDEVRVDLQQEATEGAVAGAIAGGGVGAAAGLTAAALVPGAAAVLLGGWLGAAFLGAATGAAVGTFAGPFLAMGLSKPEAERHARHLEKG